MYNKIFTTTLIALLVATNPSALFAQKISGQPTSVPVVKNNYGQPTGVPGFKEDSGAQPTRQEKVRPSEGQDQNEDSSPSAKGVQKSCEARQASITARSKNLTEFGTRLINTFDKISLRVQEFTTTKQVSVSGYTTLVADVKAKKAAATASLTKAQSAQLNFSCTTGDPKQSLETFNTNMKAVQTSLKEYKTSINNLIVAVHSKAPSGKPTRKPTNVQPTRGGTK